MNIKIDSSECKKCLTCTKVCSMGHLYENDGYPKVNSEKQCLLCLQCVSVCNQKAVKSNGLSITIAPKDLASPIIMRRSHRNYKQEPVDKKVLANLVNKANSAPVMGLREERMFTIVNNKDTIQGLRLKY